MSASTYLLLHTNLQGKRLVVIPSESDILQDIVKRLEAPNIAYMISGSIAANIYGQSRSTRDVDIIIELSASKEERFIQAFSTDFYVDSEMIRTELTRKGMFNIIHMQGMLKVDFFIRKDEEYRKHEFQRRQWKRLNSFEGYIVSLEDLILSKLVWARENQSELHLRDVRLLSETNRQNLDLEYLRAWAKYLDITDQPRMLRGQLEDHIS